MQKSTLSGRYSLRKNLLVMKLIGAMLLLAVHVSATNYGQSVINIKPQETTLLNLFKQIEKQSSYSFYYSSNQLQLNKSVYVSAVKATINDVLSKVFEGQNVKWNLIDNYRVIISSQGVTDELSVIKQIKGIVSDGNGAPLANVSVMIKGAKVDTVTNADGVFSINANIGDVLVFSRVGYTDQEVVVGEQDNLTITLVATDSKLDEVVVIGYGTQKRRDLTGSVSSVKADDIVRSPAHNAM